MWKELFLIGVFVVFVSSAPQGEEPDRYEPYEYGYKVEDAEKQLFFDKNELGDDQGKVVGRYSVLLPDGRLMTVEYTVTKETGFVPKISFQENANPLA